MGKRKHESNEVDEITLDDEGETSTAIESVLVEPKKKKKRNDEEAEVPAEESVIDVWLVRKPKNMPIEELENVRIPRKVKEKTSERVFHLSNGDQLNGTFEKSSKSMYYFKAQERIQNLKDNKKLRISQSVKGVATLRARVEVEDPFPNAVEETEEMVDELQVTSFPFQIKSIRRNPGLGTEGPDRKLDFASKLQAGLQKKTKNVKK